MTKNNLVNFQFEKAALNKIYRALIEYSHYEIGGILIGYRKRTNLFVISDVTIADDIGKFSIKRFIREPLKSIRILLKLFNAKIYNYIGEWHSHPSYELYPSIGDVDTMKGILNDSRYGVNFVLLIITKLIEDKINLAGFLFHNELPQFIQAHINMP